MTTRAATVAAHYARLGLRRPSTRDEVVAAYRAAAFREHPDRGGCAARFSQLTASYEAALADCCVYSPSSLRSHGAAGQGRAHRAGETNRFMLGVFLPVTTLAAVSIKLVYSSDDTPVLRAGGTSRFLPQDEPKRFKAVPNSEADAGAA